MSLDSEYLEFIGVAAMWGVFFFFLILFSVKNDKI